MAIVGFLEVLYLFMKGEIGEELLMQERDSSIQEIMTWKNVVPTKGPLVGIAFSVAFPQRLFCLLKDLKVINFSKFSVII